MTFFQEVYDRIRCATNARTQTELAAVLEIRQSSISDAKRRNSIPSDWYMKLFEKFGLNPDWIKSGTGPMFLKIDQSIRRLKARRKVPRGTGPLCGPQRHQHAG